MNKKISCILPTYNRADRLPNAIESVLSQSYNDLELIIINDCSTDNTDDVVNKYQHEDNRIIYHKNSKNLKLPASLNIGHRMSTGGALTWTSDDNVFKVNAFSKMYEALNSGNYGLVYSEQDHVDENGNFLRRIYIPEDETKLYYENIVGACFLYKREVYEKLGGYREDLFLVEDYEYWLRIARKYKLKPVHESLYMSTIHKNSLSTKRAKDVQSKLKQLLKEYMQYDDIPIELRAKEAEKIAEIAYAQNDFSEMHRYVKIAKELDSNVDLSRRVKRAEILGDTLTKIYKKYIRCI